MRLVMLAAAVAATGAVVPAAAQSDGFEQAVLDRINAVRAHPQAEAAALRAYRASFDGMVAHPGGDPVGLVTSEGPAAVDEAIAFLERQAPLPPLAPGRILALAAGDHAAEQGPRGTVGHGSPDGRGPGQRVRARGGDLYVGETISYGERSAEGVVRQLIVDDGERDRGHRALIFRRDFRFAGVGCGPHARYGAMCVIDYAATPDGAPALPVIATSAPVPLTPRERANDARK